MIKNYEIRVGNLLEWNKKPFKVCAIFRNVTENELWAKDNNELHPIPLTEEILLKCGFRRENYISKKAWNISFGFYNIWGIIGDKFTLYLNGDETETEIKYLHQLQNLYFALTGTELEINL